MDYEKRYKDALERARDYWETDNDNTLDIKAKGTMEYLFPELVESEDERISREITDFICWATDRGCITKEQVEKSNSWLAWLGKQASPVISNSSNIGKNAWSEKDEEMLKLIKFAVSNLPSQREDTRQKCLAWLKSLKDRVK